MDINIVNNAMRKRAAGSSNYYGSSPTGQNTTAAPVEYNYSDPNYWKHVGNEFINLDPRYYGARQAWNFIRDVATPDRTKPTTIPDAYRPTIEMDPEYYGKSYKTRGQQRYENAVNWSKTKLYDYLHGVDEGLANNIPFYDVLQEKMLEHPIFSRFSIRGYANNVKPAEGKRIESLGQAVRQVRPMVQPGLFSNQINNNPNLVRHRRERQLKDEMDWAKANPGRIRPATLSAAQMATPYDTMPRNSETLYGMALAEAENDYYAPYYANGYTKHQIANKNLNEFWIPAIQEITGSPRADLRSLTDDQRAKLQKMFQQHEQDKRMSEALRNGYMFDSIMTPETRARYDQEALAYLKELKAKAADKLAPIHNMGTRRSESQPK